MAHIIKPLVHTFNVWFETGTFRNEMKTAKVTPILKKGICVICEIMNNFMSLQTLSSNIQGFIISYTLKLTISLRNSMMKLNWFESVHVEIVSYIKIN